MAKFSVEVHTGKEWTRTINALRHQAAQIDDKLQSAFRAAAKQTVVLVKAAAAEIPATQGRHSGVRKRLARGVQSRPRKSSVRITSSMPVGEEALPRAFDSPVTGWFHPTFGHEPTVHQFPGTTDGWFRDTIFDDEERYERAAEEVLEEAVNIIADAG